MDYLHRAWAEIDLDALENNYNIIRGRLKRETKVLCVIKADAYGHGADSLAKEYERLGCDWFAVSNVEEALRLREVGIRRPILILGATPPEYAARLAEAKITQALYSYDFAERLSRCACEAGVQVDVHLKLDSGMRRIGFDCADEEQLSLACRACRLDGINVTGAFTHFASADADGDPDGSFTRLQFERFVSATRFVENSGIKLQIRHCCNSAATICYPEMQLDMVREGITLYGLAPGPKVDITGFKPMMSLKAGVSMVKRVAAGEDISYGRTFTAERDMEVATVPIGYADGYLRAYAAGYALIKGRRAKIVGRVCMDQLMLDVTGLDVSAGDTVTLFGRDGDSELPVEELSELASTINYETVCLITKRVPRVYIKGGKIVGVADDILVFKGDRL